MINTKTRSNQIEMMDDFEIRGNELTKSLDQLSLINLFLGGNLITLSGLNKILKKSSKDIPYKIVDLGCGNGEMLRVIANYGKKNGFNFELIGIDANPHTISYAKELSLSYKNIRFEEMNVLSERFKGIPCDITLSTLFLHHFDDKQIMELLKKMIKNSSKAIIVNDLHRHRMAYYLFSLICLGIRNKMTKNDGLISILKGFKKEDLEALSKELNLKSSIIWKWAFRYQWIITK